MLCLSEENWLVCRHELLGNYLCYYDFFCDLGLSLCKLLCFHQKRRKGYLATKKQYDNPLLLTVIKKKIRFDLIYINHSKTILFGICFLFQWDIILVLFSF